MKILIAPLHYWYANYGGEVGWSYDYFNNIGNENETFAVVANSNEGMSQKNKQIFSFYHKKYEISELHSLIFHILCFIETTKIIKKHNPEIIHHYLPFSVGTTFNLAAILGFTRKRKFIIGPVQSKHTFPIVKESATKGILMFPLKILSKITLKKADAIYAITEDAKKELVNFGVDAKKIYIIPPGMDMTDFKYELRPKEEHKFTLISVGQLIPRKGFDYLIEAFKIVNSKFKNSELIIIGDGEEKESLLKLSNKLNLNDNVKFLGRVDREKIVDYYLKSNIFVSMSHSESWGQVYVEALSCGLPIVATMNAGSNAIVNDRVGLITKDSDTDYFAKAVIELLSGNRKINPNDCVARAKEFDIKVSNRKVMELYKSA